MASRFSSSQSHLHQRDPRSSSTLFDGYDRNAAPQSSPAAARRSDNLKSSSSSSAAAVAATATAGATTAQGYGGYGFINAYPSTPAAGNVGIAGSFRSSTDMSNEGLAGYRKATPNSRGQYSDAVLSSLESQNDEEIEGISARVKMLKNVSLQNEKERKRENQLTNLWKKITLAIGDEVRDSTALAEKMNDTFDSTRVKLRGTMNRMLRMAEKTGVAWKIWVCFFMALIGLFWWVWVF
ncbi:protein transport protein bet1 [Ascosphaera aggregata]|nr:protein transport protein bet1 [Ascosphaera aggregata]